MIRGLGTWEHEQRRKISEDIHVSQMSKLKGRLKNVFLGDGGSTNYEYDGIGRLDIKHGHA